jgi:hypothetical protein
MSPDTAVIISTRYSRRNQMVGRHSMTRRRRLFVVIISLLLLIAAVPAIKYRQYAYAIVWHSWHGNYATFAGHRIKLPLFWWEENDPLHWDTYALKRAYPSFLGLQLNDVEVSHIPPAFQMTIVNTDQEELDQLKRVISASNNVRTKSTNTRTLATIRTKSMTLYCIRTDLSLPRLPIVDLICYAPKFPYSVAFAATTQEDEVKSILSTLE